MSEELSIKAAASRLGVTEWAVRQAVERGHLKQLPGRPFAARLDSSEVERFRAERQRAAIKRLGTDMLALAEKVSRHLHPPVTAPGPRGWDAVARLNADTVAAFGADVLRAASLEDESICRWCAAATLAVLHRTPLPTYGPVTVALLGRPCARDVERMAGTTMAVLRARVHGAAVGPSEARAAASGVPGRVAAPRVAPVAAVRPSVPVSGPASASVLRNALEAAGAPPTARYVGRKRCGTPVGEWCGCHPPRAVAAAVRVGVHPCGCECELHQEQS